MTNPCKFEGSSKVQAFRVLGYYGLPKDVVLLSRHGMFYCLQILSKRVDLEYCKIFLYINFDSDFGCVHGCLCK